MLYPTGSGSLIDSGQVQKINSKRKPHLGDEQIETNSIWAAGSLFRGAGGSWSCASRDSDCRSVIAGLLLFDQELTGAGKTDDPQ